MTNAERKNRQHELEKQRRELWIKVCSNVAGAINCDDKTVPAVWADEALKSFDKTFGINKKHPSTSNQ